ncbi:hypothetical protein BKA59DRAFT_517754 [Fusarium tricinctum]|uniref:Hydrophobin n=1 Tax=Fusarium tricinctum TaxID=61284 RepID=A0A8K0W785_9HYPO|nr:hypothetical protein BKA59DRAFT_517754 [Fusarium tricinctum]
MKASMIIALPALALTAANPVQVEERQLPGVPGVPGLDLSCISKVTGLAACVTATPDLTSPAFFSQLLTCPLKVIGDVIDCII